MNAHFPVSAGVFEKPDLCADSKPDHGLIGFNRDEIRISPVIPGGFPETVLVRQIVLGMGCLDPGLGFPGKSLVETFHILIDRASSEHCGRSQVIQTVLPLFVHVYRLFPDG